MASFLGKTIFQIVAYISTALVAPEVVTITGIFSTGIAGYLVTRPAF